MEIFKSRYSYRSACYLPNNRDMQWLNYAYPHLTEVFDFSIWNLYIWEQSVIISCITYYFKCREVHTHNSWLIVGSKKYYLNEWKDKRYT